MENTNQPPRGLFGAYLPPVADFMSLLGALQLLTSNRQMASPQNPAMLDLQFRSPVQTTSPPANLPPALPYEPQTQVRPAPLEWWHPANYLGGGSGPAY